MIAGFELSPPDVALFKKLDAVQVLLNRL